MTCEWRDKVDAYLDNELSEQDDLAMSRHLQSCQDCAAAALGSRKLKLSIKRAASGAFAPSAEFQSKIRKATAPHSSSIPSWLPGFALAAIAVILVVAALGPGCDRIVKIYSLKLPTCTCPRSPAPIPLTLFLPTATPSSPGSKASCRSPSIFQNSKTPTFT